MRGDVLVVAKGFEIATRNASAVVDGITRIRQELSVEFGVYRGSAAVHTFDRDINVPVLRRAVIAGSGGATSMSTRPLSLDATDLWDRQLLGTALELDVALSSRSRGLTMQVAGRGDEVVSKVLAATGWRDLTSLGQEPVGEVVVAAELAKFVGGGADVARAALRLRDEGASWGLVAVANGLRRPPRAFPEVDAVAVPVFGEPRLVTGYVTAVSSAPTTIVAGSTIPKVKLPLTTPTTAPGTGGSVVNVVPVQQDPPIVDPIGTVVRGVGNVIGGLLGN
jgi:hypothetical protein